MFGLLSDFDTTAPQLHARETATAAVLELEVPRFRSGEITLTPHEDGRLTITGRRAGGEDAPCDPVGEFLFGYSQPSAFRREVHLSPKHYDVAKASAALDLGVLTVTVPKLPKTEPVRLMGPESRELVLRTTPEEFEAVARAKWPPAIKRDETADGVTYRCELPPAVTKDHIELVLDGRRLTLSVQYKLETRTAHGSQSQSVTYSTALAAPQGTTAADVRTEYDGGVLTIRMGHGKPSGAASIPVQGPAAAA